MPVPPEPDPQDPYPYSFDERDPQRMQRQSQATQPRKRKSNEEDESVAESILDELDEGLGCSNRLLGCAWQLITLLPRLVWKVISEIFD